MDSDNNSWQKLQHELTQVIVQIYANRKLEIGPASRTKLAPERSEIRN